MEPTLFTDAWWDYVFANFKISIIIGGAIIGAIIESTSWKWDDNIFIKVKNAIKERFNIFGK